VRGPGPPGRRRSRRRRPPHLRGTGAAGVPWRRGPQLPHRPAQERVIQPGQPDSARRQPGRRQLGVEVLVHVDVRDLPAQRAVPDGQHDAAAGPDGRRGEADRVVRRGMPGQGAAVQLGRGPGQAAQVAEEVHGDTAGGELLGERHAPHQMSDAGPRARVAADPDGAHACTSVFCSTCAFSSLSSGRWASQSVSVRTGAETSPKWAMIASMRRQSSGVWSAPPLRPPACAGPPGGAGARRSRPAPAGRSGRAARPSHAIRSARPSVPGRPPAPRPPCPVPRWRATRSGQARWPGGGA
jgi:hypothetical protein